MHGDAPLWGPVRPRCGGVAAPPRSAPRASHPGRVLPRSQTEGLGRGEPGGQGRDEGHRLLWLTARGAALGPFAAHRAGRSPRSPPAPLVPIPFHPATCFSAPQMPLPPGGLQDLQSPELPGGVLGLLRPSHRAPQPLPLNIVCTSQVTYMRSACPISTPPLSAQIVGEQKIPVQPLSFPLCKAPDRPTYPQAGPLQPGSLASGHHGSPDWG